MNLEFVLYDHFTPHLIEMKNKIESFEKTIRPASSGDDAQPFEDDGAHCDDDVAD